MRNKLYIVKFREANVDLWTILFGCIFSNYHELTFGYFLFKYIIRTDAVPAIFTCACINIWVITKIVLNWFRNNRHWSVSYTYNIWPSIHIIIYWPISKFITHMLQQIVLNIHMTWHVCIFLLDSKANWCDDLHRVHLSLEIYSFWASHFTHHALQWIQSLGYRIGPHFF